jgi:hypothetical protein
MSLQFVAVWCCRVFHSVLLILLSCAFVDVPSLIDGKYDMQGQGSGAEQHAQLEYPQDDGLPAHTEEPAT